VRTYRKSWACQTGLFIAITLLFLPAAGFSQSASEARNGYWWQSIPEGMKIGYVIGYTEGAEPASTACQILNVVSATKMSKTSVNALRSTEDFDNVRFGQYEKGLDDFYRDFRNMSIHVSDAMPYVRDQIKGFPTNRLKNELDGMRKASVSPGYDQ
jgi:hypothetical protein